MDKTKILMDPTAELSPAVRERLPRLDNLQGKRVGLLDISKARGDIFLNRIAEMLEQNGATVNRYQKPTFARIAPTKLKQKIVSECDVVIEGLAD